MQVLAFEDIRSELGRVARDAFRQELPEWSKSICEKLLEELDGRRMVTASSSAVAEKFEKHLHVGLIKPASTVQPTHEVAQEFADDEPHEWTRRHVRHYHAHAELQRIRSEAGVSKRHQQRQSILNRSLTSPTASPPTAVTWADRVEVRSQEPAHLRHTASAPPPRGEPPDLPDAICAISSLVQSKNMEQSPQTDTEQSPQTDQLQTIEHCVSSQDSVHGTRFKKHHGNRAWASPLHRPNTIIIEDDIQMSQCQHFIEGILLNVKFQYSVLIAIVLSAVEVGAQANYTALKLTHSVPLGYLVFGCTMTVLLSAEVILRLFVYRLNFFCMNGWAWNVFDLITVAGQASDTILEIATRNQAGRFPLRLLCLIRLIRVIRYLNARRRLGQLRTLIHCVMGCSTAFCWTIVLIFGVIFTMSVFFTELVLDSRLGWKEDVDHEALNQWYGSLWRSILSLFQVLVGGVDWDTVVEPLIKISPLLGVVFVLYIAFAVLALLNVVTGVFVDSAVTRAHRMKDITVVNTACRLFDLLDLDQTGKISEEEFESQLYTEPMQEYLADIDVDVSEAKWLFEILDIDRTGAIDFDEFLSGCLRLRGPAKALDLLLVTRETRRMFSQILLERKKLEFQLGRIFDILEQKSQDQLS